MPDLKENERIDVTGFGTVKIIQDPDEFCYGVDAVLLADFATKRAKTIKQETRIMDLGTGSGIVPLILSHKTKAGTIMGIEIQMNSCDRAVRSAELNDLSDRLGFINCDIKDLLTLRPDLKGNFDLVTCNPPYMPMSGGMKSENAPKMIARHETTANMEDFIRVASSLLKDHGEMILVHRPARLVDIFYWGRTYRLEPKTVKPVIPKLGDAANIVLVHLIKNGGVDLQVMPPIPVHNEDGSFTEELKEAYL